MTISEELNKLINSKEAIRQSIIAKGTDVGTDVPFSDYASKIDEIQTGSGGGSSYLNPDFFEIRTNGGADYSYLFYEYSGSNLDLSNWDTSKVTDMSSMFYQCQLLTSLDVSNWNTYNVTSLYNMFGYCTKLTSLDLSGWDTSKVTDMSSMFYRCIELTSLDLSGWDTSKVTTMGLSNGAFTNCGKLELIKGFLDCSSLSTGLTYNGSNYTFKDNKMLVEVYLTNIYKNVTMTNSTKFSINLGGTIIKDECLISIINELPDLINDKGLTETDKIVLTLPPTNTLTAEQVQVATQKGWNVANTTY